MRQALWSSLQTRKEKTFASGIVSGVLDGSSDDEKDDNIDNEENEGGGAATAGDDDDGTNAQIAVPITDQDQRDANLAAQLGLNADIVEEEEVTPIPTPTPTEEEPPEFVTFCFLSGFVLLEEPTLLCFDTMEDCKLGEGFIGPVVDGKEREGFVTPPPDSGDCEIVRNPATGEPIESSCTVPPP